MLFLSEEQKKIRDLFAAHGGRSHGPRIETFSIPEESFWQFIDELHTRYNGHTHEQARCKMCNRLMNFPDDMSTADCGGNCLRCLAEAGDPDCQARMTKLSS